MNENGRKHTTTTMIAILSLNERDFVGFMTSIGHGGNISYETPPQSLVFPIIEIALAFLKSPSIGTSPSISLNERFNFFKEGSFSKTFGIEPDKLFLETSRNLRPSKKAIDEGKGPSKELPCKLRYSKLKQFPMELGISPDKLLSKISSCLIFVRLPTSKGSLPVNEL